MGNFCEKCGTEKIKVATGEFDGDTGEPTFHRSCPRCAVTCYEKTGKHCDYRGGGLFSFKEPKCIRCGHELEPGW